MENETNEVIEPVEVTPETTGEVESNDTPTEQTQEPLQEAIVENTNSNEFDLGSILDSVFKDAEEIKEESTQEKTIWPNFDNKPITEKELVGIKEELAAAEAEFAKKSNELHDQNSELETKLAEIEASYELSKAQAEKAEAFELALETKWQEMEKSQPILYQLTKGFFEGQDIDIPKYFKNYAQQIKEAATSGTRGAANIAPEPIKKPIESIYKLSNSPYAR